MHVRVAPKGVALLKHSPLDFQPIAHKANDMTEQGDAPDEHGLI